MTDVFPARPSFWRAVGLTFRACVRNARACVALGAAYAVLTAVPNAVFGAFAPEVDPLELTGAEAFALIAFTIGAFGTLALVGLLVYPATLGGLSLIGEATVARETVELGVIARRALDRAIQATGAFVLVFLMTFAPLIVVGSISIVTAFLTGSDVVLAFAVILTIALLVPAVYVFIRCSVAIPAVVTEGLGPVDAIRRSWDLMRGGFWWALGVFFFTGLAGAAVGGLLSAIARGVSAAGVAEFAVATVRNAIAGVVSVSLTGVAVGVVYASRAIPARAPAEAGPPIQAPPGPTMEPPATITEPPTQTTTEPPPEPRPDNDGAT